MDGDVFRMAYRVGDPEVWAVADMHKPGVLFVPVNMQPTRAALIDAAIQALEYAAVEEFDMHFVPDFRPFLRYRISPVSPEGHAPRPTPMSLSRW